MKHLLRLLAVAVFLGANVLWFTTGANHGWTKTRVPVTTFDAVTGLSGVSYESRFVPGLDFLVVAVIATTVLATASFLFANPTQSGSKAP
jgi:hypothetical protein